MTSFIKFKFLFRPICVFILIYTCFIAAPTLSNISLEELEAFEQELAKMSPEEWDALNNEINNTINNMSEEERQKLFAEAALEAERLENEFRSMREQKDLNSPQVIPKDLPTPKKTVDNLPKPNINQSEKNKNLENLNNFSNNLDYLQLIASSNPLLRNKLECNSLWINFLNDYYLLHSMINGLINNSDLQDNLLMSEWDNLRADIIKWNNALNLIHEVQCSDGDKDISDAEAEVIFSFIKKLLTNNSTETLTWSLKRMMQKYAEEEFQKIEKFNKDNKQVYRFPTSKKDSTSVKLGFPEKKNINTYPQNRNYQPRYDNPAIGSSSPKDKKRSMISDSDSKPAEKNKAKENLSSADNRPAPQVNGKTQGNNVEEKKELEQKPQKNKNNSSSISNSEKKEKSFVLKPEKRLIGKLNKIADDIETLFSDINDEVLDKDNILAPKLNILRSEFADRLLILSFQLSQIQLDLMEFYDKKGLIDPKIAKSLAELLDKDQTFKKQSFQFAELKNKFDTLNTVSSFNISSAINKNKSFKINERLENSPDDFKKNYAKLMIIDSIKPDEIIDIAPEQVIKNQQYLIYDIIDRLLTITSLSDDNTVRAQALKKLKEIRLAK